MVELAVIQEQLGYALAPVRYLPTIAAALMLEHAGSLAQRERWLTPIVNGDLRGTVGIVKNGVAALVPDAETASVVVLVDSNGASVLEKEQIKASILPTMDVTRSYSTVFPTGKGEELGGDVDGALARVLVAVAAESLGIAQRALDMAVEYAKARVQFGHPIAINQAVSHRCAQMLLEVESARSLTYFAAWTGDADRSALPLAAACAKAYACDAGRRVTNSSHQVHGGIAFTWEHDLHLFMKRGRLNSELYGASQELRARVADAILSD
jgi:alkylation response protein AidB-like acyl-CoA dehydrogenase